MHPVLRFLLGPRVCAIIMSLILAACAGPGNIAPDKLATVRRVAVVSLVGHELTQTYIGFTVFGNEREKYDIRAWNLDAAYEEQAAAELRKLGAIEAVPALTDREAFMRLYANRSGPINPDLIDPEWSAVAAPLRELAARTRADTIVVALTRGVQDPIGRSPQWVRGLGVYARGMGDTTGVAAAHVIVALYAVDPVTLKTLAMRGLSRPVTREDGTSYAGGLVVARIDATLARTPFPQWSEEQKAQVRKHLLEVTGPSWNTTLKSIFGRS